MTKLLTICIPTYKRPATLRRCIDSIVAQIEKSALSNCVDIYVANDASPDDTVSVLQSYASLSYFNGVTREQNLGMNVNIKCMLTEVAKKSDYQLIITDDDYLQPDILVEIAEILRVQQHDSNRVPAIWTPRYAYTEDGNFVFVVCNPFPASTYVRPSAANAGKYMKNGFVLSGLIVRAECIDFEFWEQYKESAYFPMIFFGDLLLRGGAYYWNKNIVQHTVLNKCHWESWGKNNVVIGLRKFSDVVNSYGIMAGKIKSIPKRASFYASSFLSIRNQVNSFLLSEELMCEEAVMTDAVRDLKARGILKYNFQLRLSMLCSLLLIAISILMLLIRLQLATWIREKKMKEQYQKAKDVQSRMVRAMPRMLKLILA